LPGVLFLYNFDIAIKPDNMDLEQFQEYCLSLASVTEEFPFGEQTLVYKVKGKIFALTNIDHFESVNLKCDPEEAEELRERYEGVTPGYHMNKKHWNTVRVDAGISKKLLYEWIKKSYDLVVASLPKKDRESLL
jgi:predicted DNA-binding protein (MmcQ/YjbR family)